ncbi:hypothetical protein BDW67DRAFT_176086 [Aspergillus spinulosporus]
MSTVVRRFISYVGNCSLSDFKNPTHATLDLRIKYASVEGTDFHQSHKDRTDPKQQKAPAESQDGGFEKS